MSCTVREAQQRVSSKEYTEWVQFYKQFPWDYGSALIVACITNMMRKEGTDAKSYIDFMPADFVDVEPVDPNAGMWDHLRKIAAKGTKQNGKH